MTWKEQMCPQGHKQTVLFMPSPEARMSQGRGRDWLGPAETGVEPGQQRGQLLPQVSKAQLLQILLCSN